MDFFLPCNVTQSPTAMKRSPLSLHVRCRQRYGCSATAGNIGDVQQCRASPVVSVRPSSVIGGMDSDPPPRASRLRVASCFPSPLIAQWKQRRYMHHATPASVPRSHNAPTMAAITDNQLRSSVSTASPDPSSVCTPSSFTASTSGSTDHTSEALLLAQLHRLAKEYRGKPESRGSKVVVDSPVTGTEVPVIAKAADDLAAHVSHTGTCVSGSPDDSTFVPSHSDEPAWKRGLELVQSASCATEAVMEWLLFVCLRSSQSTADAAGALAEAPLEVCEGVYSAWRELHRGQKPEIDTSAASDVGNAVAAATPAHELPPSLERMPDLPSFARAHLSHHRSPFSPKGLHHHYATYLLRALYHAQTAAVSQMASGKGSNNTNGDDNDSKEPMATKDSGAARTAVMHRTHYLLHRVLEVLLVHLPQDLAAVTATEQTCGVKGTRLRKRQVSLRPTTALLVLEAVRHAARLHMQASTLSGVGASQNFPLLSFLLDTPKSRALPKDTPGESPVLAHSALAAVAREAFETIMRSSATAPNHMSAAPSQKELHHRLQNDALVLYVAFLATVCVPPMSEHRREVELQAIDNFALIGSSTAQQLCAPSPPKQDQALSNGSSQPLISTDRTSHDQSEFVFSASAQATAAGVRWLMDTYLSPLSPLPSASSPGSALKAEASPRQWDLTRNAVLEALCWSNSLIMWNTQEPSSAAHVHERGVCVASSGAPPTSLPWCAWMLRVLLHSDAHQQQKEGSGAAYLSSVMRSDADEMSTLALSIRLVMELRRHSQEALARHGNPLWKKHRQHRLATLWRQPLQLVWATLLHAAVQGQLIPESSCRAPADNSFATQHSTGACVCPYRGTPAVLQRLFYPHYDKVQWRRGTVNVYLRLLDQWGESTQVQQVFAAVARREREWQQEVQKAVLSERRDLVGAHDEVDGQDEGDSASIDGSEAERCGTTEGLAAASTATAGAQTPVAARVFCRYRPALNLESCLITLRHCGFPRQVFSESWDERAGFKDGSEGNHSIPASPALARLAGEVVQYMICLLHVAERGSHRAMPKGGDANANDERKGLEGGTETPHVLSADGDPEENLAAHTMEADGLPVSHWVAWIRKSCVPALAHLYQSAGLEDEWVQLGYGHK
ncbi:hypothetical protein, conserved [Leishmania tarentolae]|uniref:Uncharacterized protein n=1 Tax=Leishmania tarentolae TaxID=5689 RepID=A0A640KJT9_LEITA|nr:hypothetical protein, conserved [Leishmania tarentolae]